MIGPAPIAARPFGRCARSASDSRPTGPQPDRSSPASDPACGAPPVPSPACAAGLARSRGRQRPARRGLRTGRRRRRPARRRARTRRRRRRRGPAERSSAWPSGTRAASAEGQREASVASLSPGRSACARCCPGSAARRSRRARRLATRARSAPPPPTPRCAGRPAKRGLLARRLASDRDEVRRLRDVAQRAVNGGLNRLAPGGKQLEDGVRPARRRRRRAERRPRAARRTAPNGSPAGWANCRAAPARCSAASPKASSAPTRCSAGWRAPAVRVCARRRPARARRRALRRSSPQPLRLRLLRPLRARRRAAGARALAGEAVSVGGGGQAARMLVVSTDPFNTAGSRAVGARLRADAERIGRDGGLRDRPHRRRRDPQRLRRGDQGAAAAGDRRLRPRSPS